MKKLIGCFFIVFLINCSGGGGGGGNNDTGTAPRITNVELFRIVDGNEIQTIKFFVGDETTFKLYSTDPDRDISKLIVDYYYPVTSEVPYYSPSKTLLAPSQQFVDMFFYPIEPGYIDASDPTGQWRIEFYLIDDQGHESNIWEIYVSVSET